VTEAFRNLCKLHNVLKYLRTDCIVVVMVMTPYSLIDGYQHFGGTYCANLQSRSEDGVSRFSRNAVNHLPDYTVS
jgi:hypothetical protein